MKLPLAYYGNSILRKKGQRIDIITDEIRQLVADMEETMIFHDGIGIAAPQVHQSLALFLTHVPVQTGPEEYGPGEVCVFINPKILEYSQEEWLRGEGCLSIPNVYAEISRPLRIRVEFTDLEGNQRTEEFFGLQARAFLHENDHINGTLFIDRVKGRERDALEPTLRAIKKKYGSK